MGSQGATGLECAAQRSFVRAPGADRLPELPILEVSLRTGVRVRDMENLKRKQVMSQKEKYKRAAKGDIAYNMMRMWQGALGPAPVDGLVSPAYVVVKPFEEANSAYYSYLFRTDAYMREVNKFSRGIVADRNRLYWDEFKQMPSLVPPRPEQDQIVAYLRVQDGHIARLIKAKRDLIRLLTEQKLRIIDHAVTRGLDASVALKPSGIEWLGMCQSIGKSHFSSTSQTCVLAAWTNILTMTKRRFACATTPMSTRTTALLAIWI